MLKTTLIGRLGEDAKNITLDKGSFITMRVASNKTVNKEDITTWVTVNANTARYANMLQYLKKGTAIVVVGDIYGAAYFSKEKDANGNPIPKAELRMNADAINFLNLGGNKSNGNDQNNSTTTQNNGGAPENREPMTMNIKPQTPAATPMSEPVVDEIPNIGEDLPF